MDLLVIETEVRNDLCCQLDEVTYTLFKYIIWVNLCNKQGWWPSFLDDDIEMMENNNTHSNHLGSKTRIWGCNLEWRIISIALCQVLSTMYIASSFIYLFNIYWVWKWKLSSISFPLRVTFPRQKIEFLTGDGRDLSKRQVCHLFI